MPYHLATSPRDLEGAIVAEGAARASSARHLGTVPLAPFDAIGDTVNTWRGGAGRGLGSSRGFDMSTMSMDVRRKRRSRAVVATYGVAFVTIALVLVLVQIVGHESGQLFAHVSQGLSY